MTILPLSDNNQPNETKQRWQTTLAGIGGAAAGTGVGFLGSKIVDADYQKKMYEQGMRDARDKGIAAKNWETLLDLYDGNVTMNDLPPNKRDFFTKQLEENHEDLAYFRANPEVLKKEMDELKQGATPFSFFGDEKPMLRNFLFKKYPNFKGTEIVPHGVKVQFPHDLHSPNSPRLISGLGLAGMALGAYAMEENHEKNNLGKFSDADLIKLQNMLEALKTRDESHS